MSATNYHQFQEGQQPGNYSQPAQNYPGFNPDNAVNADAPKNPSRKSSSSSSDGPKGRISLAESEDRMGFVKKVYGILATQLLVTAFIALVPYLSDTYRQYMFENVWVLIVSAIFTVVFVLVLSFFRGLARTVPTNYILLFAFTFCEAILVAYACAVEDPQTVITAVFMTAGIVVGLTIYAMTTKSDYTTCGAALFMILAALIMFGIFAIIFNSQVLYTFYCLIGVVVFGFYIIMDTQLIIGGHQHQLSEEDYIVGAMILYMDIIVLFLKLLRLLGRK